MLRTERYLATQPQGLRLGITGSPGAGKSTFIEAYGKQLVDRGERLAVLAIDPSSTRTHGSILGDKTRMQTLSSHPLAYVRPSPAGRTLGGVTKATREAILLCEAAGYRHIVVETVGVGQSEHTIRLLCDCMALLVLPGSGDDLQGIKRGIVELADLVIVNKADGERERLARQTRADYGMALHLRPATQHDVWSPKAITASSVGADGLAEFHRMLGMFLSEMEGAPTRDRRHRQQADLFDLVWREAVVDELQSRVDFSARLRENRSGLTDGTRTLAEALAAQLASLNR